DELQVDRSHVEMPCQTGIQPAEVIDPDRGIDQNQRGRRRGIGRNCGSVPPSRANRRAASRSISAFSASRTRADFSCTLVNCSALASNSSSIAIVVRIEAISSASNIASIDADFYAADGATYAIAGRFAPSVTSTISGGTPRRNGMMLQPRPPETTTSQFM